MDKSQMINDMTLVSQNLPDEINTQEIDSDNKLLHNSDTNSLSAHNEQYTEILAAYVTNYKLSASYKRDARRSLFRIVMLLMIALPITVIVCITVAIKAVVQSDVGVLNTLPALITALGTFVGTYLLIYEIIAKYTFNESEENNLVKIIDKIQEYDREIRGDL